MQNEKNGDINGKINLKSNLLIKLFGKDEVSLEELQEKEEFVLDGQGIAFTEEEIENIKSDLAYVFEELKERVCELSIGNCPDSMRDYVIKNAPTTEIYFEGRDELTENEVDVSDEFKKSCGDIETEYDLFDYIKTAQSIDLKPLITLKDIDLIQNYANISDFKIEIENEQEYQALLQIAGETIEYEYDDDGEPAKRNEAHNLKGRIVRGKMCV